MCTLSFYFFFGVLVSVIVLQSEDIKNYLQKTAWHDELNK